MSLNQESNSSIHAWILIPARGGSKAVPRKNLRQLAGKPLILHVLANMGEDFARDQIIVSTDDLEIEQLVKPFALIHPRPRHLATDSATLDQVASAVAEWLIENGAHPDDALLTIQPTSPFIRSTTILRGLRALADGASSVLTVRDDRHLRWTIDKNEKPEPLFTERLNRQWLPPILAETGGLIGTRISYLLEKKTRIVQPVALLEVSSEEGLDIDDFKDWAVAKFIANRKRIVIRTDGGPTLGMGHIYRAIALAQELGEHQLMIVACDQEGYQLGAEFLAAQPYPLQTITDEADFYAILDVFRPDVTILDILDTTEAFMGEVVKRSKGVVTLEDLGPGSRLADVVINDLYTDFYPQKNHWYGVQNAILSPHFETINPHQKTNEQVEKILIAFGGTDPKNLTLKALMALSELDYIGEVIVVLGPGYSHGSVDLLDFQLQGVIHRSVKNMAMLMQTADLAITSAGRTVTELMTLGIPTLVMCQNSRELRHTHASSPFGVMNLGLGEHVAAQTLAQYIVMLLKDFQLRCDMRERALQATQGRFNRKIAQRILAVASPIERNKT